MAAKSPGQTVRPRQPKESMRKENTHTYESFTRRIARLKIDPVHDVSKRTVADDASNDSHSHFRAALDEWTELNLSATWTSFVRQVDPLSENLPQLLHHADTIFDLLLQHIKKKDGLALEPLLSLAAHFAHDLGKEFEKYFAQTISLIAEVAATHDAADVVEWCFTSIAWLFKYLSRLLVQDLRPLFGIMKPYVSARKEHIARFSAESLAFLMRKAMGLYPKRKAPLTLAARNLLEHVAQRWEGQENHFGLLTLLVESSLGIERALHSTAEHLVQCLLDITDQLGHPASLQDLLEGFVVGVVHRTDTDGFQPILNAILDAATTYLQLENHGGTCLTIILLQAAIGTRKASRIQNWSKVLSVMTAIYSNQALMADRRDHRQVLLSTSALVLQYAPVNELLPFSKPLLEACTISLNPGEFFGFCTLVADLSKDKFHEFVLPQLQGYIVSKYSNDEAGLTYLLDHLRSHGMICGEKLKPGFVRSSSEWDKSITQRLEASAGMSDEVLAGIARLTHNVDFPVQADAHNRLSLALAKLVSQTLTDSNHQSSLRQRISAGWLFEALTVVADGRLDIFSDLWGQILQAPAEFYRLKPFLDACINISENGFASTVIEPRLADKILNILTENMLASSTPVKISSLRLLQNLHIEDPDQRLNDTIKLLVEIGEIGYSPATTRKISMLLRRLPQRQKQVASVPWMQRLIPFFCLGQFSIYHDSTKRDLCSILGNMLEESSVQDTVFDIFSDWLRSPPSAMVQPAQQSSVSRRLSPFECSNLNEVRRVSLQAFEMFVDSAACMRTLAEEAHQFVTTRVPESGRALALEALTAMPTIAERRSRMITPVFLNAQFGRSSPNTVPHSESSATSHTLSPEISEQEWEFKDRRAFLKLLGEFQNPKVLFRANEVHDKLMDLLRNGNAEMRKLALAAILRWKHPVLLKHEKVLFQVIEEKTANVEIGVMLNVNAEQNPVQADERPVFLNILLRLLYGSIIGRSGSHGSQEARRKSILRMLFRMEKMEVNLFLGVTLGGLVGVHLDPDLALSSSILDKDLVPSDQQYGFLRLMQSFLETLQTQFAPYGKNIIDPILYCTLRACRQIGKADSRFSELHRNIRRTGLQCLEALFKHCADMSWESYMPVLFAEAISPRLEFLPIETAQGISSLLRIFSVWGQNEAYIAFFSEYDRRLPSALWQCLAVTTVKPEVQVFILNDILHSLLEHAQADGSVPPSAHVAFSDSLDILLQSLSSVLQAKPAKDVLVATTSVILGLAPLTTLSNDSDKVLELLVDLLGDGKSKIPPAARSSILSAIQALLQSRQTILDIIISDKLLHITASLFNYFRDPANRLSLSSIMKLLSPSDSISVTVTKICHDLNAVSTERLDEVDYDLRLQAFQNITSLAVEGVGPNSWRPIVYNLLFFVKDQDFTIRSNAVSALKDFILRASASGISHMEAVVRDVVLPAVRDGVKEDSEVIRADMLALFGLVVQHLGGLTNLLDLKPLLVDNDEEASFFNNIMHIQQHRRLRAIRRLTSEVEQGKIRASNVAHIFIPLLLKFIRDHSTDDSAQSIRGQSLQAMPTLLRWIDWKQFKTFFRQTKQELEADEQTQRTAIKILVHAAEALSQAWGQAQTLEDTEDAHCHLAASLPPQADLTVAVKETLLTKLSDFIHYKDEAEMSARLPAATIAVHLIKLLPAPEIAILAGPIVLDVSNVLRSKSSDSRDAARRTLTEIVTLLGPSSVLFVLKELRNALRRGYQLHVLSYTMHSILVTLAPSLKIGDLDYCLQELSAVIMDDVFGIVGQEKENQDYISSMKEVKSSKSFDSMELLARSASMSHLSLLLDPIVIILTGSLTSKQTRQVDDLLRRIGIGLARNSAAGERDILNFAYQAIQSFYKEKPALPTKKRTQDERNRERFLIKHVSDTKVNAAGTSPLLYKIARFAIDNVRSTLQKHTELLTPENVHGFLPIIGDALVEAQEDVKTSALRLLSAIIKLRMPELDQSAPLYVLEAVKLVRHANSTNDEAAQAALKLVAAILRERRSVKIRESEVAELLRRITPDLEEPDRQGVTFNFIRAVMTRKYELPELYELLDKIGIMMVTNHTKGARDIARGVYVHFLLEYPQSPARWTKQQKFIIKNLEYDYPEGRESVMEAINMLLGKTSGDTTQQLLSAFFIPIVLRMANDDHQGCRDLAGALLGQVFRKAASEKRKDLLEPLRSWVDQMENPSLIKIGMQAFVILFNTVSDGLDAEVKHIKQSISSTLQAVDTEDDGEGDLLHQTLQMMLKLAETRPASILSQGSESSWASAEQLLQYRNPKVQGDAASIIAAFFSSCKPSNISKLPLSNAHGLKLDEGAMRSLLKSTVRLMKNTEGNKELSGQAVSILAFLGRCVDINGLTIPIRALADVEADVASDESNNDNSEDEQPTESIPAIQYLLDQCSRILRRESPATSIALVPKTTVLSLLTTLIPHLSSASLPPSTLRTLLLPLVHLTDTNTQKNPRSADPTFSSTYTALIASSQEVVDALQTKAGDQAYIKAMTEVSRLVRERREERRRKRNIERVAQPERAAQTKRKKMDRKKERNREVGRMMGRRRKGL